MTLPLVSPAAGLRRLITLAAAFVAVILCSTRASATPITWTFTGPVELTFGLWVDPLPLGSIASLTFTWEPETLNPPDCVPGTGRYSATSGVTLSVLGASIPFSPGAIEVNAPSGNCIPNFGSGVNGHFFYLPPFPPIPGLPNPVAFQEILAGLSPVDTNAADLASILADVNWASVQVSGAFGGGFRFSGPLQPVPEPTSLVLVGGGLLAVAAGGLRFRKR